MKGNEPKILNIDWKLNFNVSCLDKFRIFFQAHFHYTGCSALFCSNHFMNFLFNRPKPQKSAFSVSLLKIRAVLPPCPGRVGPSRGGPSRAASDRAGPGHEHEQTGFPTAQFFISLIIWGVPFLRGAANTITDDLIPTFIGYFGGK